jgi:ABC-type Fe3+/spermidine/putrescine transport system ATPase subunit
VQQVGTPGEIYRRPASPFVARFVGDINMLDGRIEAVDAMSVSVAIADRRIIVPRASVVGIAAAGRACQLACRPESVRLSEAPANALSIEARVTALHRLGPTVKAVLDTPLGPLTALAMADTPDVAELTEGKTAHLSVPSDTFTLFAST